LQVMAEPTRTAEPAPAASATTVRVLFFGPVRVRLGIAHDDLACAGEMSAEDFWSELIKRHAELHAMRATIRLARDGEFLAASARVRPGDEIALIPPVSGG
jgi:molybdopterin converting factor subunit 1